MKMISGVIVLLVCVFLSSAQSVMLTPKDTFISCYRDPVGAEDIAVNTELSEDSKDSDPIDQPGLWGFCAIMRTIEDYYGVDDLDSLEEGGQMLKDEIYNIYNQIINAIFITENLEVEDVYELDQEANQTYGYKAARSKTLSYNFIAKDGQKYTKSITFRYEPTGEGFPEIKPIYFAFTEAAIDIMNPPLYYYYFEEDSVRFEEIF
ncbi:MAG: hypothetical protein P9L98_02255 [Candidatus Kaelpia imicola]|nr:hypothetical protein [Candidatus Kaelpia imicola]